MSRVRALIYTRKPLSVHPADLIQLMGFHVPIVHCGITPTDVSMSSPTPWQVFGIWGFENVMFNMCFHLKTHSNSHYSQIIFLNMFIHQDLIQNTVFGLVHPHLSAVYIYEIFLWVITYLHHMDDFWFVFVSNDWYCGLRFTLSVQPTSLQTKAIKMLTCSLCQ